MIRAQIKITLSSAALLAVLVGGEPQTVAHFHIGRENLRFSQRFGSLFICFTDLYSRRHALLKRTCWLDKAKQMFRSAAPSFTSTCLHLSPPLTGSDLLRACEVPVPDMADGAGGQLGALRAVLHLHRAVQRSRVQEPHCKLLFLGVFLGRRLCTVASLYLEK